jgi:sugar-specific transcriptional regulator TrmB
MKKNPINIDQICDLLDIHKLTKRVLLFLIEHSTEKHRSFSVVDIASNLSTPKSSIYDAVNELIEKSIVIEYAEGKAKSFGISSLEQLEHVYKKKMSEFESAHKSLITYIQENADKNSESYTTRPKIRFYYGVEGIRQAFRDTPWSEKHLETYLMWPMKEMVDLLGEEFLIHHGTPRLHHKIDMKVVQKFEDKGIIPESFKWKKYDQNEELTEIRYAPQAMNWNISYWIYGDKVLFAGSGHEKYAFVVQSREFASLMKLMWEQMWSVAKH